MNGLCNDRLQFDQQLQFINRIATTYQNDLRQQDEPVLDAGKRLFPNWTSLLNEPYHKFISIPYFEEASGSKVSEVSGLAVGLNETCSNMIFTFRSQLLILCLTLIQIRRPYLQEWTQLSTSEFNYQQWLWWHTRQQPSLRFSAFWLAGGPHRWSWMSC